MDERIIEFLQTQKVATICCTDEEHKPYCFSCFYAFDPAKQVLYFKTSAQTHHAGLLLKAPAVAGTVQPDKLNPLAIKGIQFSGEIVDSIELTVRASAVYHKKYPFALAMKGDIWTVHLNRIKMTDNTLSFGKKISWEPELEALAKN